MPCSPQSMAVCAIEVFCKVYVESIMMSCKQRPRSRPVSSTFRDVCRDNSVAIVYDDMIHMLEYCVTHSSY